MDYKEQRGREEMVESARFIFSRLREAKNFGQSLEILKVLNSIPEDFDLDRKVGEVISGLRSIEGMSQWLDKLENAMQACACDSSVYQEWTLAKLDEEIRNALRDLAKTILGVNSVSDSDVDLLIGRFEAEESQKRKEVARIEELTRIAADFKEAVAALPWQLKKPQE